MCLIYTKQIFEDKPKIGYKVVVKRGDSYISLFRRFNYKIGKTYTSEMGVYRDSEEIIVCEAIHLFQDLKTAQEFNKFYKLSILECQILNDAIVYSGTDENGRPNYAVSRIKVLREI